MPGIAGIIGSRPAAECERAVAEMIAAMKHEPFYESGTCTARELGVYAGWTAHAGSFAARQSTSAKPPHLCWLISGECLSDAPEDDLGTSYARLGDDFVRQLNGLFSGLLIDRARGRVLLFNDPYGLERIYVHEADDAVYFASEAKALLKVLPQLRAFDDEGVAEFVAFGCTRGARTLFRDIRCLRGGALWCFERGARTERRSIDVASLERQSALSEDAFNEELAATFKRVLPRYLGGTEGVGISLTAGLDTRMIMACLPPASRGLISYTFSGQHERTLDERIAGRIAAACALEHRVLRIDADFLTDYGHYVDKTVRLTDGCFGATGAHEVYLNRKARQLAPVRLTGVCGSEVLRSMSTLKPLGLSADIVDADFGAAVARAAGTGAVGAEHPVTFSAFHEVPASLFGSLAAARSQVTFRTPFLDSAIVSLAYRAPARSRRSPASALHLIGANAPRLARIPTDRGVTAGGPSVAGAVRRLAAAATFKLDYLHKEGLPHHLSRFERAIDGFSRLGVLGLHKYLPYRRWFRKELSAYVSQTLTDAQTSRLPYWNHAALVAAARDHVAGRRNYIREINAVLTLEAVNRLLLRGSQSAS